jgi:hypothetical protein
MPGTSQAVADEQSLLEGGTIVGAGRTYGEQFRAASNENHRLAKNMSEQHTVLGDGRK